MGPQSWARLYILWGVWERVMDRKMGILLAKLWSRQMDSPCSSGQNAPILICVASRSEGSNWMVMWKGMHWLFHPQVLDAMLLQGRIYKSRGIYFRHQGTLNPTRRQQSLHINFYFHPAMETFGPLYPDLGIGYIRRHCLRRLTNPDTVMAWGDQTDHLGWTTATMSQLEQIYGEGLKV